MEDQEIDLRNLENRIRIIAEIKGEENLNRKRDQQRRFDVYNDKQDIYILERLRREFSEKTVSEMRKILSINLAKRIIDEKSSVYNRKPDRSFTTRSGVELTEDQEQQLEVLYDKCKVNVAYKRSNIFYNLNDQCAIMCVPDNQGSFKIRAIPPMHYDVIPSAQDPEKAHAYILNTWDYELHRTAKGGEASQLDRYKQGRSDGVNQTIADDDDRKAKLERMVVWTKDYHFVMNGKGEIQGEIVDNEIGMLPFIDVAPPDKDFQFFVRRGSSNVEFSLDYGMMLSDNANVIRLQAYSQAVIVSEKLPQNTTIGPNHVLHLKLDPNKPELSPRFEFITPNPDLSGTQAFLESLLSLHLTAEGQDPSILTTKGDGQRFSSGLDRLLAMIAKFDASRDDFDLYRDVEDQLLKILVAWSNRYQDVQSEGSLKEELRIARLPEDLYVKVKFAEPEAVQTKKDLEESVVKLVNEGLMSRKQAMMKIYEVSEGKALEMIEEIDAEEMPIEPRIVEDIIEST